MASAQIQQEALSRAQSGQSLTNYSAIYTEFAAKGIPMEDIKPRENVLTFNAWKALGRSVKKGEHGVKVITFLETSRTERDKETGEEKRIAGRRPWTTTVFHISQTRSLNERETEQPKPAIIAQPVKPSETAKPETKIEGSQQWKIVSWTESAS